MRRDISQKTEETAYRPFQQKALGNRIGFRFADGQMRSLPYLQLIETQFHPDIGVILEFAGHRVTLSGQNLQQLYCELEAEEIGEIIERHTRDFAVLPSACYVETILWEKI